MLLRTIRQTGMVVVALAVVAVAVGTFDLPAYASSTQPDAVPGDVQVAPQSDEDGDSELPWLFAVFAVTWAAFFGYTFVMSRRQREMRREIEILQKTLQEKENKALAAESETEPPGSPTEG